MLLMLQKFTLEVKFKPGCELAIADCLSRDYMENARSKDIFNQNELVFEDKYKLIQSKLDNRRFSILKRMLYMNPIYSDNDNIVHISY